MASPTTPRYCKYFFSARGCNQGNDCKYLHQQMDEVRMELPCTALSIDIETTGCWPGVHKIVAIGVALFQLSPAHQVVELDRRMFQFKVNYPQDFDEITMRDFWHVQGRMELLEMLQNGAVEEEEAIKDFYNYYTEVCYRYPKFFLVTDNPVMDLGFLNLSIATKLRKPPLTYRPVLRSPRDESAPLRLAACLGASLEPSASSTSASSATRSLSETESDDELSSTDGSEESDEDAFGESGEEDGAECDSSANASAAGTTGDRLLAQASELAKRVQLQTPVDSSNKKLASFYDDYSAPHFAIDLNSFACGLVGLHLPPFRRAGGSRWASPADFLSYHKPYLVCPYRKTHDPVDDASFNCWQFLQCISIVWMNEHTEMNRIKEELAAITSKLNSNASISNSGSLSSHQPNKCDNSAAAPAGAVKSANPKSTYNDAEFPTIASANATSNERRKQQQQQQQRSPRRGRAVSTLAVTPDKAAALSPSRGSSKQQAKGQLARQSPQSAASPSNPHKATVKASAATTAGPWASPSSQVQRRTARSHSDPPALTELTTCSNTAAAIAKASAFCPERTVGPRQQRTTILF